MHHTAFLSSALALLSLTSAFVLPGNLGDGNYAVRRSADGSEVHASLNSPALRRSATTSTSPANLLTKRDTWGTTWCGCGFDVDHGDTDAAVADLKSQLGDDGKFIDAGVSYYSIKGSVVAFVCNYDHNSDLHAWTDLVTEAASQISDACGLYMAGSQGGELDFAIGYMRNSDGLDFCANALTSPAHSCAH